MSIGCKIIQDFERPSPALIERFKDLPVANIDDNMGRIAAVDAAIEPIGCKGQLLGSAFTIRVSMFFKPAKDIQLQTEFSSFKRAFLPTAFA